MKKGDVWGEKGSVVGKNSSACVGEVVMAHCFESIGWKNHDLGLMKFIASGLQVLELYTRTESHVNFPFLVKV